MPLAGPDDLLHLAKKKETAQRDGERGRDGAEANSIAVGKKDQKSGEQYGSG